MIGTQRVDPIGQQTDRPARINLECSPGLKGETTRLFEARGLEGFWDCFVRPGLVLDIGYKGGSGDSPPVFRESIGIDLDTPGYDGRTLPYGEGQVGSIHASHVLEHIPDFGHFFRDCLRVLSAEGTLILFVPLKDAYERQSVPPSRFNSEHIRYYTAGRLLYEIESSLPRDIYRVVHLRERFRTSDFTLPLEQHAQGPYEIECVVEKITADGIY